MGKISRDCDKDVTSLRVEKLELTPLSGRICGLKLIKLSLDRLIRKEDYVGLQTDTVLLVKVVRTTVSEIPSQYETYT